MTASLSSRITSPWCAGCVASSSQSGQSLEDLIQVGTVGLIKAADKFDPYRGCEFAAFAIPVIVGEVKNYFREHGWAVKVPRKLQRHRLLVDRTVAHLTQKLGRSPTVPEIADATGITEEEVFDTFEVSRFGNPLSLDAEVEVNGNPEPSSLIDSIGRDDPGFELLLDRIDLSNSLDSLDSRERAIIYPKYYCGLSQTEIAWRVGVSQMHVSRLQRLALSKLRRSLAR